MSSDNGIYILKTKAPDKNGFEYRVIHAQAIENIYYDVESGKDLREPVPETAFEYFGKARFFRTMEAASDAAHAMADEYPILEYGVCTLHHPEWVFQTFTEEETESFNKRSEEIMERNRKKRDQSLQERREAATMDLIPGTKFTPTRIYGIITAPDGEMSQGEIFGQGVDEIVVGLSNGKGAQFLPHGWNEE